MERGKFIVFEGVGGSGKTTQIEIISSWLRERGYSVVTTREPGGIDSAEKIRDLIFRLRGQKLIGPEGQMVLFFAARYLWLEEVVKPALELGKIVLTDRCHTSTAAYQGYAEGGDLTQIEGVSKVVMGEILPDAVILLDVSPRVSVERRQKNLGGDPFDREGIDYVEKLVAAYRKMAKEKWENLRWCVVDGEGSVEEVTGGLKAVLKEILDEKN